MSCSEYNELIRVLRETDFSDGCPCGAERLCENKDCVMLQAADAIEELMKRCEQFQYMPPPAWIPVTERLPEAHKFVLCCGSQGGQFVGWVGTRVDGDSKVMAIQQGGKGRYITHWMPLPEPPKGEDDGT